MREKLVNAILEYASDEIEENTLANMARESEEELVDRLIAVTNYYYIEYSK